MEKLRIVVGGFIGLYPSGGVTWDYIQYIIGLKLLGHDVYYIEDTGQYSTYRIHDLAWNDPADTVDYLKQTMENFGFKDCWAYRDTFSGKCFGMSLSHVFKICSTADVFINVSDANIERPEYLKIPKRVLIDSDPMFTQVQRGEKQIVDDRFVVNKISLYDYSHHFTFGENICAADCKIPKMGISWIPTRQPICLDYWSLDNPVASKLSSFTTIMNWSTRLKLRFQSEDWGQKDVEFQKFISVPSFFEGVEFKIIMAVSAPFKEQVKLSKIESYGWKILDPSVTITDTIAYRDFIKLSGAEFSVAKETYVKSNSGWFSCRSACYLAMGKPVITQETQWSKYIPSGLGALSFEDVTTAVHAIGEVQRQYKKHSRAAKEISFEFFESGKVLTNLLYDL